MNYDNISINKNTGDTYTLTIGVITTLASRNQLEQLYVKLNEALAGDLESGLVEPDPVTNVKILSMGG